MGWRFRRSIKIFPGIRLNLSRSGVSTSVGVRGAHVTIGHGQVRKTVGIPGTGLSYSATQSTHHAHQEARSEGETQPVTVSLSKGRAWRGWVWIALIFAMIVIATLTLSACGSVESSQEAQARDKLADANPAPVVSCAWDSMEGQRLNQLSHVDEADLCNAMQSALGRLPPVALARKMSKLVLIMQVGGSADTAKEITYQTMNVVEARGQVENDKAIDGSMEAIAKIFSGSEGHVTPKDLNIFLRSAGPTAMTLTDDGLLRKAAVIWAEKKANGQ